MYKALTYVNLPPDNIKAPGEEITEAELSEAGQTEDDIAALLEQGAISEDMDAPINEAHAPVEVEGLGEFNVIASETGKGE
jgi:hypothetical protein